MSIQHGKVNIIIKNAVDKLPKEVTEKQIINALYDSRAQYINNLKLSSSLKKNLIKNRTIVERQEVLKLVIK